MRRLLMVLALAGGCGDDAPAEESTSGSSGGDASDGLPGSSSGEVSVGNHDSCPSDISLVPRLAEIVADADAKLRSGSYFVAGSGCDAAWMTADQIGPEMQGYEDCARSVLRDLLKWEIYCEATDALCRSYVESLLGDTPYPEAGAPTSDEVIVTDVFECAAQGLTIDACDLPRATLVDEWASSIECTQTKCERRVEVGSLENAGPLCVP